MILHLANGETGHQLGQGGFELGYRTINYAYKRTSRIWAYSFNRNQWFHMRGPVELIPNLVTHLPQYDPIHDVMVAVQGNQVWTYSFHFNKAVKTPYSQNAFPFCYSTAMDTKRGRFYIIGGGSNTMRWLDLDSMKWNSVSGTIPPTETPPSSGDAPGVNCMTYDENHDKMIYVSDIPYTYGSPEVRTWAFDCETMVWQELQPTVSPLDRGRIAYNKVLNLVMMVGGASTANISRGGSTQGVWLYRPFTGATVFDSLLPAPVANIDSKGGSVKLTWNPVSNADGYNVYRATAAPFPGAYTKLNSSLIADNSFSDPSATKGTSYAYRICAVDGAREGLFSRLHYTRPKIVLDVVASIDDTLPGRIGIVRVSWLPNSEQDLLGYHIYRAAGAAIFDSSEPFPAKYTKLTTLPISGTEYIDTVNLSDGVARGYVITAINDFGMESGTSTECTTFPNGPERAWCFPSAGKMAFRVQPPHRTRIKGFNLYRATTPPTKQNTTGLIVDSVTTWNLPPNSGEEPAQLLERTFFARAVNILNQEGFMTDQFSPTNSDFGYGIALPGVRFDYSKWNPSVIAVEKAPLKRSASFEVWPNPFNPVVTIRFHLEKDQQAGIEIFDINGKLISKDMTNFKGGIHKRIFNLSKYASGFFIIRLTANSRTMEQKVLLLR